MTNPEEKPVLISVHHHTGVITLNRPKALNSLTGEMVGIIGDALEAWRDDDQVEQVLIESSNEKAFCAGGDVRWARDTGLAGNFEEADAFFAREYDLNETIAEYPKPFIAVLDGVVMGGGVGLSVHGSHRIVTRKAFMAMPEMNIGFVTDVAAAWAAQREIGTRGASSAALAKFWVITGYRQYAADMLWTGLATHVVDDAQEVIHAIIDRGVDDALHLLGRELSEKPPLAEDADVIEETFGHDTWPEIAAAVANHPDRDFAEKVEKLTAQAAPTSLVAAAELTRAEERLDDIHSALHLEEQLGKYLRRRRDFAEGVRAVLVDKKPDADFDPKDVADVDVDPIRRVIADAS